MQVQQAQKKVHKVWKNWEIALRTQMRKFPALQPFARKPYTTYLLTALAASPVFFIGPILGLIGSLGEQFFIVAVSSRMLELL